MSLWESFRVGLNALGTNRLRSFLTMLGIIIGVSSVITMVAVGVGAQQQIAQQIRALGANLISVYARSRPAEGEPGAGARHALVAADVAAIEEQIPAVAAASPFAWASGRVIRGARNVWTTSTGVNADYFTVREWPLSAGRVFFPVEEARAGKVAVLGALAARELFGEADPVGAEIRIGNVPLQVIGVLAEKGASGGESKQDTAVFVPFSTLRHRLAGSGDGKHRDAVDYILVKAGSEEAVDDVRHEIEALLRQRHRVQPGQRPGFGIGDPAAELAAKEGTATAFAWLMAAIASVSLVVGGISIMNIMLVSVTERTREIGLRMALGARRRDIRRQFLMEALTLCLLGGLIGLAVGLAASLAIAAAAGWPIFLGLDAALFAMVFAAAVGVFFGWYPARKAARLEPVEALRSG